ncbi:MAG: hypothetical protein ACE5QV_02935, partial [Fidelibacterota bacterium]
TADELSTLGINFLKIHNLHVVEHTELAKLYSSNPFHLYSYDEYLELLIDFLERLSPDIVIERLVGESPPSLLIAPTWRKSGGEVQGDVIKKLRERESFQGKKCKIFKRQNPESGNGLFNHTKLNFHVPEDNSGT